TDTGATAMDYTAARTCDLYIARLSQVSLHDEEREGIGPSATVLTLLYSCVAFRRVRTEEGLLQPGVPNEVAVNASHPRHHGVCALLQGVRRAQSQAAFVARQGYVGRLR